MRNCLRIRAAALQYVLLALSRSHGQGRGIVAQRATWIPTNLQELRVKQMNDGEIFNVVTNGRRSMPAYKFQVGSRDRWAIVAYVRALQRTSTASVADVPEDRKAELK